MIETRLCSRQQPYLLWTLKGNKVFRKLINSHLYAYINQRKRKEKAQIVMSIFTTRSMNGMRMLEHVNDSWVEMIEIGIKKNIVHALRDASRGERQLSSQARGCLAALKRYNNMALAQILEETQK